MTAIAFVLVALLSTVATLNASPKFTQIANGVIYGSCVAALVSVVWPAWFLFRAVRVELRSAPTLTTTPNPNGTLERIRTETLRVPFVRY